MSLLYETSTCWYSVIRRIKLQSVKKNTLRINGMYELVLLTHFDVYCPHPRRLLQVVKSEGLFITTKARWYDSKNQIHEDLVFQFFDDHISSLKVCWDTNSGAARNPLVQQVEGTYRY